MGNKLNKFFEKILDLVYPKGLTCIVCDRELEDSERGYATCKKCFVTMKRFDAEKKLKSGVTVYSCFHYEDAARQLVLSYKDSDKPFITEYMAKFIKDKYIEKNLVCDGIVYVPSSHGKINRRGYDALKFLADHLSKELNIPVITGLLKSEDDVELTKVPTEKREDFVKGRFYVENNEQIEGKRILLIDDVITTGATLNECAKVLLDAKAAQISAIAFTAA
ncbi:MAG TPA: ComF family protein [Clostridia bacterium]|nr:ComF family protein [Clostridia bacterium]